jgi:hypothetical protein
VFYVGGLFGSLLQVNRYIPGSLQPRMMQPSGESAYVFRRMVSLQLANLKVLCLSSSPQILLGQKPGSLFIRSRRLTPYINQGALVTTRDTHTTQCDRPTYHIVPLSSGGCVGVPDCQLKYVCTYDGRLIPGQPFQLFLVRRSKRTTQYLIAEPDSPNKSLWSHSYSRLSALSPTEVLHVDLKTPVLPRGSWWR